MGAPLEDDEEQDDASLKKTRSIRPSLDRQSGRPSVVPQIDCYEMLSPRCSITPQVDCRFEQSDDDSAPSTTKSLDDLDSDDGNHINQSTTLWYFQYGQNGQGG